MEGKRITADELFRRDLERRKEEAAAADADPEVQARRREFEAHERRMREAEERFAKENAITPYDVGRAAAEAGLPREAPNDLGDDDAERWLDGFDSLGSNDADDL